jgi:hypothetical protein
MRAAADSAQERVAAIVYLLTGELAFDGDAVRLPVGKVHIVACRPAYRQSRSGQNIVKALYEMVNARAYATGCPIMSTFGIPSYCKPLPYLVDVFS